MTKKAKDLKPCPNYAGSWGRGAGFLDNLLKALEQGVK